jgi:hypothetical protein
MADQPTKGDKVVKEPLKPPGSKSVQNPIFRMMGESIESLENWRESLEQVPK